MGIKEPSDKQSSIELPVLRWRWVVSVALIAVVVTSSSLWWLLSRVSSSTNIESVRTQLDAIRIALSVGVGTGGLFALWLATRRQRTTELQLTETARISAETKAHQERVAEVNEIDLLEKRIAEQYQKAVEQLGHAAAPVRLGGLYALERLGSANETLRETIMSVLCAYLRMPYLAPERIRQSDYSMTAEVLEKERSNYEELQVRNTAQEIITRHVRKDSQVHWGVLNLDLTGATLVRFELSDSAVGTTHFNYARFIGPAYFQEVDFTDEVWFFECTFETGVGLHDSIFRDRAIFTRCEYGSHWSSIKRATFEGGALFHDGKFENKFYISDSEFYGDIEFDEVNTATRMRQRAGRDRFVFKNSTVKEGVRKRRVLLPEDWEEGSNGAIYSKPSR